MKNFFVIFAAAAKAAKSATTKAVTIKAVTAATALLTMTASCAPKAGATLDVSIGGMPDGTKVYLLDDMQQRLDSTEIKVGRFHFDIRNTYPDLAYVAFDQAVISFFVEPGAITGVVTFDGEQPVFSGTPTNDMYNQIQQQTAPFTARARELEVQLAQTQRRTPAYDSLVRIYYAIEEEADQHLQGVVMANPGTVLAAYRMYAAAHTLTSPEMVDSVLTLIDGAPANAFTDRLRERREVLAESRVNAMAPDFTQNQPDGTPLSLSSLRGKLVLIDFWASWCGPCRAENPNVVKLYNRFKENGFEILGVSLDNNREAWLRAIEADGLTWRHVSDLGGWNNAVAKQYAVQSIPHTVLVGPDGRILAKNLRGAALESKVAEILTGEEIEYPSTAN